MYTLAEQNLLATMDNNKLTNEDWRNFEIERGLNPRRNKLIIMFFTMGGTCLGLLIFLSLLGRSIYLKRQKKEMTPKRKIREVQMEEGYLSASETLPNETDLEKPVKRVTFNIPPSSNSSESSSDLSFVTARSDSPTSDDPSPTTFSLESSTDAGNNSEPDLAHLLAAFPINTSNAVSRIIIHYGDTETDASFVINISSEQ
ncbi:uncharacterized protein [Pyxicephalus adspersus]